MTMHFSAEEAKNAPSPRRTGDPVACERCAAAVELLTVLPRTADHSAYRIFACTACNYVQWIPE
jgi:DNA-directed RNA polymerase subunit M/transcription elongation factor TFIIS